jgi:hypothetical protein
MYISVSWIHYFNFRVDFASQGLLQVAVFFRVVDSVLNVVQLGKIIL